jgi:hypothetical protein
MDRPVRRITKRAARAVAEELGDTILVRIGGKMITDAEALVLP